MHNQLPVSAIITNFDYHATKLLQAYNCIRLFFKENIRYPVWTRFSLILGTRFSIVGTRIGSLKHLKKTLIVS